MKVIDVMSSGQIKEPAGGPTSVGAYQDGQHCPIPRRRA
jgi:hypothetical protein